MAGATIRGSISGAISAERLAISGFGVRGVGSFYYLAFALNHAAFPMPRFLWATVSFIVLLSIILHGLTGTRIMEYLDTERRRERRARSAKIPDEARSAA